MTTYVQSIKGKGFLLCTFIILTTILAGNELHAQWVPSEISKGRYALAATSLGSKAFFCRRDNEKDVFKIVDIYDNNTRTWSTDSLSEARLDLAATSVGTKVFFAGGMTISDFSSVVDIYDIKTNSWTYANLSEPRCDLSAASLGTKVFFLEVEESLEAVIGPILWISMISTVKNGLLVTSRNQGVRWRQRPWGQKRSRHYPPEESHFR